MSARLLKAPSPIGIQLDSLADDITFGLAPAMMLFCYLRPILGWWALAALQMAAFSALRLAKFNVDERQHDSFIGLATPANAIFWGALCCMPYAMLAYDWMAWVLIGLSLVSCYLLNAEIPFFSFKSFRKEKTIIICFLAGSLILIGFCVGKAIVAKHIEFALFSGTAVIIWYVALNLLLAVAKKN
jgi:CDP-diacylglycerol--serine O-phosphatidyltransferase